MDTIDAAMTLPTILTRDFFFFLLLLGLLSPLAISRALAFFQLVVQAFLPPSFVGQSPVHSLCAKGSSGVAESELGIHTVPSGSLQSAFRGRLVSGLIKVSWTA